jgi:hypothetical protein
MVSRPWPAGVTRLKGSATTCGSWPGADASKTQPPAVKPMIDHSPFAFVFVA